MIDYLFNCSLLVLLFIILFLIYLFLPEILVHFLGIGSWKRQYSPGVALTFDDGPDPLYTPRLLEVLKKLNVKACFFLVGEKMEKYPDLVKKIEQAGHQIGSHGYLHRHSWLLSPRRIWNLWDNSLQVLRELTGKEPDFIRAPWGGFNLTLLVWCLVRKKRIVVWNTEGRDWRKSSSPQSIIKRILRKTNEGTIVLLHDSGGDPGAPENTLACMEELILQIRTVRKLPVVPLTFPDWSWPKRMSFRLWEKWERFYARINHIQRIDYTNMFRLSLTSYRGPDLINKSGEVVATAGDQIGEIHFDNIRFQSMGESPQMIAVRALNKARRSLPGLARYIVGNPDFQNIKVFLGLTMISRGARGLGFTVQDYPSRKAYFIGLLQKIIRKVYHPSSTQSKTDHLGSKPKLVWITREKLFEKYLDNAPQP